MQVLDSTVPGRDHCIEGLLRPGSEKNCASESTLSSGSSRVPGAFPSSSRVACQVPTAELDIPEIEREIFLIPIRPVGVGGGVVAATSLSNSFSCNCKDADVSEACHPGFQGCSHTSPA